MTTYTATYSPEDNKLRLYSTSRLERALYERVRASGFAWAPKQELFVAPMWTPEREDLLLELCGEIDDEDTSLVERAEERASRFDEYSDNRRHDSEQAHKAVSAIADNIPLGQPILVGHHSERHARRDAERIENGMRRAIKMWDTAQYWQQRAKGALRAAKYKERPDVRARRIKTLEAAMRKQQRNKADSDKYITAYTRPDYVDFVPRLMAQSYSSGLSFEQMHAFEKGELPLQDAIPLALQNLRGMSNQAQRWIDHYTNRVAYERAMLGEAGGTVADKTGPEVGGGCKCWASPRGGWSYIQKVNKVSVTVLDNWGNGGKDFTRTIPFDKLAQIMTAAEVQEKREAGLLVEAGERGFFLRDAPPPERKAACEHAALLDGGGKPTPSSKDPSRPVCAYCGEPFTPSEPGAAAFEAMRATLRTGVQVVSVPQLFPTPPAVARRMVDLAGILPGMRVLEPSAGTGNLLDMVPADAECYAVEKDPRLFGQLSRNFPNTGLLLADFLDTTVSMFEGGPFDVILMNPPFENGADIKHINHAYRMLKPGGTLVAICAGGPRQEAALRPAARYWHELPADTFAGTSVSARLIVLEKAEVTV